MLTTIGECGLLLANLDVLQNSLGVAIFYQGAHQAAWVERVFRLIALGVLDQFRDEFVMNGLFNQKSGWRRTDFALVVEDSGCHFSRVIKIFGIPKYDIRALAAAFQPDQFHVGFCGVV
ncbi:hypothetical protein D9M71_660880 [compost metagenome]